MSAMLNHIAAEVMNRALLCTPAYAETMLAFLSDRIGINGAGMAVEKFTARDSAMASPGMELAVIPVLGSLAHRAGFLEGECGMRSYQGVAADLDAAQADPRVGAILLDIDSPGGTVSGAFDLADKIRAYAENGKKIYAYASDMMCSAAYLVASQCNNVFSSQTGMIGSIGVVMAHMDRSKQLEMNGVRPTFIFRGSRKTEMNSMEPLSDETRVLLQKEIDVSFDMFVSAVKRGRNISEQNIIATEAGIFNPVEAKKLRLIDGVKSPEEMVAWALEQAQHGLPQ